MKRFHISSLLLAIVISSTLWYMVIGRELVDTIVEMRLDYRGIPAGVVVRSGLENKVRVRMRGPEGLISILNTKNESYVVDLSKIKPGNNIVPLNITPPHAAFTIMEITPPQLTLVVDTEAEKEIPLQVVLPKDLPKDITIINTKLSQKSIKIRGPAKIVASIHDAKILIEIPEKIQEGILSFSVAPIVPPEVEAIPNTVSVTADIQITTKTVTIRKAVQVRGIEESSWNIQIKPEDIQMKVTVPASMTMDTIKKNIDIYVMLPRFIKRGTTRLPIRIHNPETIQILSIQPQIASVVLQPRI